MNARSQRSAVHQARAREFARHWHRARGARRWAPQLLLLLLLLGAIAAPVVSAQGNAATSSSASAQTTHRATRPTPSPAAAAPPQIAYTPCIAQRVDAVTAGVPVYFRDCADTPEMVSFGGGSFKMGDQFGNGLDYEKPVHDVRIAPFALGRYEISIAEWQRCVDAKGCTAASADNEGKPRNHPVVGISWSQAQDYAAWLSRRSGKRYRLPSEAEWEYAARAGNRDQFTWGNWGATVCSYANALDRAGARAHPQMSWYTDCDDGFATTAPVGSFPPNAWGLYDMLGNVWEWVQDCWHSDYSGAPADGAAWIDGGDCSKRVNRGGGWGNNPRALRVSNRDADPQDARSDGMGFRIARTVSEAPPANRPAPLPLPPPPTAATVSAAPSVNEQAGSRNVAAGSAPASEPPSNVVSGPPTQAP